MKTTTKTNDNKQIKVVVCNRAILISSMFQSSLFRFVSSELFAADKSGDKIIGGNLF